MTNLISIQINGNDNPNENLSQIESLIAEACSQCKGHKLVVLPECCSVFGVSGQAMLAHAEILGEGPIQQRFSQMAKQFECFLVAGTTPIIAKQASDKYFAASLVYGPDGKLRSRYNKIHLFDVNIEDSTNTYHESKYTLAGQSLALFDSPFGQVAQSVCYDLRFADMFSAYADFTQNGQAPNIIVVPSAFTKVTGKAHWHPLLQARSIENQCFVVASNQVGTHADGRETFGNSCIYSPWGECLALADDGCGFSIAEANLDQINEIRQKMPVNLHKKERYQIER